MILILWCLLHILVVLIIIEQEVDLTISTEQYILISDSFLQLVKRRKAGQINHKDPDPFVSIKCSHQKSKNIVIFLCSLLMGRWLKMWVFGQPSLACSMVISITAPTLLYVLPKRLLIIECCLQTFDI